MTQLGSQSSRSMAAGLFAAALLGCSAEPPTAPRPSPEQPQLRARVLGVFTGAAADERARAQAREWAAKGDRRLLDRFDELDAQQALAVRRRGLKPTDPRTIIVPPDDGGGTGSTTTQSPAKIYSASTVVGLYGYNGSVTANVIYFGDQASNNISITATSDRICDDGSRTGMCTGGETILATAIPSSGLGSMYPCITTVGTFCGIWEFKTNVPYNVSQSCGFSVRASTSHTAWRRVSYPIMLVWGHAYAATSNRHPGTRCSSGGGGSGSDGPGEGPTDDGGGGGQVCFTFYKELPGGEMVEDFTQCG